MEKSKEQCSPLDAREISSHALSSTLTTFFLLVLLYFPYLLPLLFSPVLISSLLLITTLLHFGSSRPETEHKALAKTSAEDPIRVESETGVDSAIEYLEHKMHFRDSLVEWGRKGVPLEVIYEEFEGEEEDNEGKEEASEHSREYYSCADPQRRLDFMGFYTTDSDADSNSSSSSDNMRFRWEEEEGEGMIEIALEEDNLIEIDLSACR